MNQSSKLFIIAAVGVGAYLLLSKSANAGTVVTRPGGQVPAAGYGSPTANPRAQLDALNNGAAYSVGNLLRGLFSGGGGGSAPSGGGYVAPIRDSYSLGNFDYGYVPSTPTPTFGVTPTWAPDNTPRYDPEALYATNPFLFSSDTFAVNPPGGYDVSTAALYSDDMYGSWD
jgi:hypothetical protein